MDISGNSSAASCAEISSSGRPARCAHAACRRISSSRCGDEASRSEPDPTQPGARSPPASSRRRYSAADQEFIRVSAGSARSWPTSPAEWNVDPLVELGPLDEEHVALAALGEVVGHARPAHPAADDHDAGAGGQRSGLRLGRVSATPPR